MLTETGWVLPDWAQDVKSTRFIESLNLTARSENSLCRAGLHEIEVLAKKEPRDLLAIKNMGQRSVNEVTAKMQAAGYWLNFPPAKAWNT